MTTTTDPLASAVLVISVRRDLDPDETRARAYTHVGLDVDGIDQHDVAVAKAFTDAGATTADLIAFIDGIHRLASEPNPEHFALSPDGGVDSEGRPTNVHLIGTKSETDETSWLLWCEAIHAAWPRLFAILGVTIGGVGFDADGDEHKVSLDVFRVPKALRLKSGWDYDADGNEVRLPLEEAWRRFTAHVSNSRDHMGPRMLRRMREHMESAYAERESRR